MGHTFAAWAHSWANQRRKVMSMCYFRKRSLLSVLKLSTRWVNVKLLWKQARHCLPLALIFSLPACCTCTSSYFACLVSLCDAWTALSHLICTHSAPNTAKRNGRDIRSKSIESIRYYRCSTWNAVENANRCFHANRSEYWSQCNK